MLYADFDSSDLHTPQEVYDGPEGLVEKMRFLSIPSESGSAGDILIN